MKYFAFCQGDILLTKELSIPCGEAVPFPYKPWHVVTALDEYDCQILRLDEPLVDDGFVMMNLRNSFDVLPFADYQLAGKAAELLYWDSNSKFCGCCGAPMKWDTEISKKCSHCGKELWPQLSPAIIVRITRRCTMPDSLSSDSAQPCMDEEILMVRAHNFRSNHYGLVAGFVETGETLEECVRREVREEVGLEIDNIQYFGSQPWPYPCGLMIGFTASYVSGEITIQRSELSDAGWFRSDNMPPYPKPVSIAGQMVRDWLGIQ